MSFVVTVRLLAREGEAVAVAGLLREMAAAVRLELGNTAYVTHRSTSDPACSSCTRSISMAPR